jgi:hypothetical protein
VALGSEWPRADRLLGAGDCYVATSGVVHRVQCAYVTEEELGAWPHAAPGPDEWPGKPDADTDCIAFRFTPRHVAVALKSAWRNEGRPSLEAAVVAAGLPAMGTTRSRELLAYGRDLKTELESLKGDKDGLRKV